LLDLQALGIPAAPGSVYETALTHRSFVFEQVDPPAHNERLEFLGDAILEALVTDLIYDEYPDLAEGEMARLRASVVNTQALAAVARSLGLGDHIRLGKGEEASGGRDKDSLLANAFEAVVGALYLDKGLEGVQTVLRGFFSEEIGRLHDTGERYDVKTALQEVVVRSTGLPPKYRVDSSGPDHAKRFTAEVFVGDRAMGSGSGRSKKEAEYNAAREALTQLGAEDDGERKRAERGPGARAS
jgi:ribonuclease III